MRSLTFILLVGYTTLISFQMLKWLAMAGIHCYIPVGHGIYYFPYVTELAH